jgi:hypothetical protein
MVLFSTVLLTGADAEAADGVVVFSRFLPLYNTVGLPELSGTDFLLQAVNNTDAAMHSTARYFFCIPLFGDTFQLLYQKLLKPGLWRVLWKLRYRFA